MVQRPQACERVSPVSRHTRPRGQGRPRTRKKPHGKGDYLQERTQSTPPKSSHERHHNEKKKQKNNSFDMVTLRSFSKRWSLHGEEISTPKMAARYAHNRPGSQVDRGLRIEEVTN